MVLYGVRLIINIFDLFIYRRFLEVYIGKRKTTAEFSIMLLIVCELIESGINQLGINWLNFITMAAVLSVYVCQYEAKTMSKAVTVLLYMGLVVIAEPIGYIVYKILANGFFVDEVAGYYFVVFIMEIFLLIVVEIFCRVKAGKHIRVSLLPKEVAYTLILIPFASVISCFLLIEISAELITTEMIILCMCVIFSIVITNYLVFLMVNKYTNIAEKRHEEEMIYQEIAYNDEYYQDMEKYQEQIQDIKHDMKNQLAALYDAVEKGEREFVRDTLTEMLGDIRLAEDIIYSANPILNSLIKVKMSKAKEKEIAMNVKTFVPKKMSIESGDMGVLYGNLIDNAIEACMKVQDRERFVDVETKFQDGKLLIVIRNSKSSELNLELKTTKEDKRMHGRGIRTVRRVAEQYGGNLLLEDEGDTFKASLLLNDVECLE